LFYEPDTGQPQMCKGLAKSSHDLPGDLSLAENGLWSYGAWFQDSHNADDDGGNVGFGGDGFGDIVNQVHPSAISFFWVHTILHDIYGLDTIITRYSRYFTSASMVKICFFSSKSAFRRLATIGKKRVEYNFFLGTYTFQLVIIYGGYILTFCATFI